MLFNPPCQLIRADAFLANCEDSHDLAERKVGEMVKQIIAAPLRHYLRKDLKHESDVAVADLAGVERLVIHRLRDLQPDLPHVSLDSIFRVAASLKFELEFPPLHELKRRILLEELIPRFTAAHSGDADIPRLDATETVRDVEKIVTREVVLEEATANSKDAFNEWCATMEECVRHNKHPKLVAALAGDYLHTRTRLKGFTSKLIVLSRKQNSTIDLPPSLAPNQAPDEPYPLIAGLALIEAFRRAALLIRHHNYFSGPIALTREVLNEMKKLMPKGFRRIEIDTLVDLMDWLGLSLSDLSSPVENVGSLALKAKPCHEVVVHLLREEG